jgi:hypothetical protein
MQSAYLKFIGCCTLLIITLFSSSFAQTSHYRLKTADSLYQSKLYTQSFEHYEEILNQKQYTPAMLLKMAYIQEGLGNVGKAMYYLNLYFLTENDEAVLEKMEELAARFNLGGYEASDADRFLTFYHEHYSSISIALAALTLFLLSLVFYTKVRLHRRPIASGIVLTLFLAGLFVHLNFGGRVMTGIISNPHTYVMDGPSPGANLISITTDGHRVEVIGKKDIWLKIRWDGRIAFIRENSLLPVEL